MSALAAGVGDSDSDSESEENGVIGASSSSSSDNSAAERNGDIKPSVGVTHGSTSDDTDEEKEEEEEKIPVTNGAVEPETEIKKVSVRLLNIFRVLIDDSDLNCHYH